MLNNMEKKYSHSEIKNLINLAYKSISRKKGKDYSPTSKEIEKWIDDEIGNKSLKISEPKESTGADSAGGFESAFGSKPIKNKISKIHNMENQMDIDEVTTSSSSGQYDVPFSSNKKNPLRIDGEKSIKQSRAVKDKNFPKWGGPGGVFIKVKDKCKKFPYCNQGDINAIEMLEMDELNESITNVAKKTGIPTSKIEKLVINEINKIFIK
jgi:hypothetical protein